VGQDPDSIQREIRVTRRELAVTAEELATRASLRVQARRFGRRRAADMGRLARGVASRLRRDRRRAGAAG
jgi:hypothetical protein